MVTRPIPVHPELTAVAVKAPVPNMIADQVLPEFPVTSEAFKWNEYPHAQGVTVPDTLIGRKSRTAEVEFGAIERDGSTQDHGLQDSVPITDATANSDIDAEAMAAEGTSQLVTLAREVRTAALVFNPSTYLPAQVTAYAAGAGWTNTATDVLGQFEDAKDAMLVDPNTLTVGLDGLRALRKHPQLVQAVRPSSSSGEGRLTIEELKELLEIETILVGRGQVNFAKPGQDPQLRRVWVDHASLTFTERVIKNSKSYTFGATARLGGKKAYKFFDKDVGLEGANVIRIGERLRELIVAQQAGWLFQNAAKKA
ncbi:MAG: hypothetical protein DCF29_08115 [Alphaproteobacteria bacterium]|nr:MAG: hypothetical protein DCF29_08115 [Alphaproteobacteria bacterium]